MTCIASILSGLMDAIDGWTMSVLTATASDIEASASKNVRESS